MTHVTCRLTAKNRDQLRNPALGNRVWATFIFLYKPAWTVERKAVNVHHWWHVLMPSLCLCHQSALHTQHGMWPVSTDGVTWSVCLLVTIINPAEMAESIQTPKCHLVYGLRWARGTRYLMRVHIDATWQIRWIGERRWRALCQITVTTCFNFFPVCVCMPLSEIYMYVVQILQWSANGWRLRSVWRWWNV